MLCNSRGGVFGVSDTLVASRGEVPKVDTFPRVNFLYPDGFLSSEQVNPLYVL